MNSASWDGTRVVGTTVVDPTSGALDDFHIDRRDWPSLAADRVAWRETLRLGHPPDWQPPAPTPPLALRRQTRRAAIDTNCNIDASLRMLRAPLPQ